MRRAYWFVFSGASLAMLGGCAPDCFDDGLNQHGCPADSDPSATDGASATESQSATETITDSVDGTMTDPTAATANGDSGECPELEEVLLPQVPTLQLVLDGSGSMDDVFDGGQTRWEAMESTLIGGDGVVTQLQSQVRFGMSLYRNPGMVCPDVTTLSPQLDAADEITTLIGGTMPAGDTPTGESLVIATDTLTSDPWIGDKVLVLATDGEPDTCAIPDPVGADQFDEVRGAAIDAVTAALDTDIRTYVISVGSDIAEEHLQDLANAGIGNTPDDPAPFWVANDTASLVAAFQEIIAGIRPCTFDLPKPLAAELAPSCTVTVNDDSVGYQDANGWDLPDENTLELDGTACEAIQQGVALVSMTCTCQL